MTYQNYRHYKLPITINPLEYGKLIIKIDNIYILSITPKAIAILTQFNDFNEIKFYREGDLIFSYKDFKTNDNEFIRILDNKKFTFKDNILKNIEIIIRNLILLIYIILFILFPENGFELSMVFARNVSRNIWTNEGYNFENKVFTNQLFQTIFNKFWKSIEHKFTESNHIYILFKIKYRGNQTLSIGTVQRLNKFDKQWYFDFIINNIEFKTEFYKEQLINSIIFSYGFKEGKLENKNLIDEKLTYQDCYNYKIPISMNPLDFGIILWQNENNYSIFNNGMIINLVKFDNHNEVEFFKNGKSITKFTDKFISENTFERQVRTKKYLFVNKVQELFTQEMKTKYISKLAPSISVGEKQICMDIETYMDGDTLVPFLICFYDGEKAFYFGLWDYPNPEAMILDCFCSIFIRKYKDYKVYFHNMSKFDIIFLLKYLVKIVDVSPIIHNGRIIQLEVNYGPDNQYKVTIKDSLLILLRSLDELSKAFKIDNPKGLFPFLFVNKDNLNYNGQVPDFASFGDKISKDQYLEYSNRFNNDWNLKNESIEYCILDCKSLYQILNKFGDMIFNLFQVDIHRYPTLSSLAFAIFRTKFMEKEIIPKLSGKIAENIRLSYTGGSVDMYIPKALKGSTIYCYDVNSLYPSQMFEFNMPVGNPTYFEGDISKIDPNAFGFFYCKIKAPDNLLHPILQTRVKTNEGIRTIAPLGNWTDWMFSKEIENARLFGYTFEIMSGYMFENKNIFKEYVELLYSFRNENPSGTPLNLIAKILLNSLYGRFGMDDQFNQIKILHKDLVGEFESKNLDLIVDFIELDDYVIIFYRNKNNEEIIEHNVSVGIASAITAYSRIHMTQFKNNPNITLYYTDTDSIYTDSDIDSNLIDSKTLGKLKLENTCKKAIFLAPKVYCLETDKGKIITKAKGLSHEIELTMSDYEHLLFKDSLIQKTQTKWFRSLDLGKIDIIDQVYTLKVTDNKRKLFYLNWI
jgi:hypothetical protein